TIQLGKKEYKLSELRSVHWNPKPVVLLADGKVLDHPITGLDFLDVTLGQQAVRLNLADAVGVRFAVPTSATSVACTVVAKQGDREVARTTADLALVAPT